MASDSGSSARVRRRLGAEVERDAQACSECAGEDRREERTFSHSFFCAGARLSAIEKVRSCGAFDAPDVGAAWRKHTVLALMMSTGTVKV